MGFGSRKSDEWGDNPSLRSSKGKCARNTSTSYNSCLVGSSAEFWLYFAKLQEPRPTVSVEMRCTCSLQPFFFDDVRSPSLEHREASTHVSCPIQAPSGPVKSLQANRIVIHKPNPVENVDKGQSQQASVLLGCSQVKNRNVCGHKIQKSVR